MYGLILANIVHGPRWTIDGNLDQTVSNPFEFKFFDKNLNVKIIMFDSFPADFSKLGKGAVSSSG